MTVVLGQILSAIEVQNTISGCDIIELRREVFGDNHVCMAEADRLFRLNDAHMEKAPGWAVFL